MRIGIVLALLVAGAALATRCRRCGRPFGLHRTRLAGDGRTDDTCAIQHLIDRGGWPPPEGGVHKITDALGLS